MANDSDNKIIPAYNAEDIRTLDSLEHIQARPGMYIGRLGNGDHPDDGIYILLKEVIDNSIEHWLECIEKCYDAIMHDTPCCCNAEADFLSLALASANTSKEEILVIADIRNITFIYDSDFVSRVLYSLLVNIQRSLYLPKDYIEKEYIEPIAELKAKLLL